MKIGSRGHYGLLALAELAANYQTRRALQVKEIANNQHIPAEYLGQIMVVLKRARLVHGTRGPTGGYVLSRPADTITVKEILQALEGPSVGIDLGARKGSNGFSSVTQKLIETWARGIRALEQVLEQTTLADLCKPNAESYMYYI
jgi:Rrf2 family transcriptional regulator, cysteine metabolism repressor